MLKELDQYLASEKVFDFWNRPLTEFFENFIPQNHSLPPAKSRWFASKSGIKKGQALLGAVRVLGSLWKPRHSNEQKILNRNGYPKKNPTPKKYFLDRFEKKSWIFRKFWKLGNYQFLCHRKNCASETRFVRTYVYMYGRM